MTAPGLPTSVDGLNYEQIIRHAYGKMRAGQIVIQLSWIDEPGIWKDYAILHPALSSGFQLRILQAEAEAALNYYGESKYKPLFRLGVCLKDGGWNGVPSRYFDPHGVLDDPVKFAALPSIYRMGLNRTFEDIQQAGRFDELDVFKEVA